MHLSICSILCFLKGPCSSCPPFSFHLPHAPLRSSSAPPPPPRLELMAVTQCLGYLSAADVVTVQSLCLGKPRVIRTARARRRGRGLRTERGRRRSEARDRQTGNGGEMDGAFQSDPGQQTQKSPETCTRIRSSDRPPADDKRR